MEEQKSVYEWIYLLIKMQQERINLLNDRVAKLEQILEDEINKKASGTC